MQTVTQKCSFIESSGDLEVGQTITFFTANGDQIIGEILEVLDDRMVVVNKEQETLTTFLFDQIVWPIGCTKTVVEDTPTDWSNIPDAPTKHHVPDAPTKHHWNSNVCIDEQGVSVVDIATARNLMHDYIDQLPSDDLAQVLCETQQALEAGVTEDNIILQFAVPHFEVHGDSVECVNWCDDAVELRVNANNNTISVEGEDVDSPVSLLEILADFLGFTVAKK
jgi:hypothetical protein